MSTINWTTTAAARPAGATALPRYSGDVMMLAKFGYEILSKIAAKLGFQESIAQDVYKHIWNIEQTREVLHSMQKAAKRCGEKEIGLLIAEKKADSDTSSDSKATSGSGN